MNNNKELKIPFSLQLLEGGIPGVRFEIFPLLLKKAKNQEELNKFGIDMMPVVGNTPAPGCGSMMWVIYKDYCKKDLSKFMECVNTKEKQEELNDWLFSNFRA